MSVMLFPLHACTSMTALQKEEVQSSNLSEFCFCCCCCRVLPCLHRDETKQIGEFDYVVVNREGQLDECVSQLCAILDAEKLKTRR